MTCAMCGQALPPSPKQSGRRPQYCSAGCKQRAYRQRRISKTGTGNLVPRLDSFIGREEEQTKLVKLLRSQRLVTVVGPVGVGKTRLAIEVAGRLTHSGGVWFVDLAAVSDPGQVDQAVATAVRVEHSGHPAREGLATHLRSYQALLLLDNCEHVIDRCADLVQWLLRRCPSIRVLATSREALRLSGEHSFQLGPLPIASDAVHLFTERASAVDHEFVLTDAVRELCHDLDGLPLAIELAARRVRYLPTAGLAELLRTGERTADRHRSLDTAIAWSHDLLDPNEQVALRRLSLLAGWFDATLAAAACGLPDVLDVLINLTSKSFVVVEHGKFRLLEAIRLFGEQRLREHDEVDATHERVVRWFVDLLEGQTDRYQIDPGVVRTLRELENSLAAAVAWTEGDPRRPLLAWGLAFTWARHGHLVESANLLHETLGEQPPPKYESLLRSTLATIEEWRRNTDEALRLGRRVIELEASLGRISRLARAHGGLGTTLESIEDIDGARSHQVTARDLLRKTGEREGLGIVLFNLGCLALRQGDYETAQRELDEARAIMTSHNTSPTFMAALWQAHGELAAARGELAAAEQHFADSLRADPDLPRQVAYGIGGLALVAVAAGDDERGLRLAESANTIHHDSGAMAHRYWQYRIDGAITTAESRLPRHLAFAARTDGRRMSLVDAVTYALDGVREESSPLNPRQLHICRSVAKGHTDRQIARDIGVSIRTINTYLEQIRAELGLRTRAELAAWITRHDRR